MRISDWSSDVCSSDLEFTKSDATSRTRQRPDAEAFQAAHPELDVPDPVQRWGQPDLRSVRGAVNADYQIAEGVNVYALGTITDGQGVTDIKHRNPEKKGNGDNHTPAIPEHRSTKKRHVG